MKKLPYSLIDEKQFLLASLPSQKEVERRNLLSFDATCQGLRPVRKGEAGTWTDYALPLTLLWAYLVVVLDLFARKPGGVGNEIQFSPDNKLAIRALEMVWERQGSTTGKK